MNWFRPGLLPVTALLLVGCSRFVSPNERAIEVKVTANRCGEVSEVPANRLLHLTAEAYDLSEQSPAAELVDEQGTLAWTGKAVLNNGRFEATLPPITESGEYFFRLYREQHEARRAMLREYAIRIVNRPRKFAVAQACTISFARRCILKPSAIGAWARQSR